MHFLKYNSSNISLAHAEKLAAYLARVTYIIRWNQKINKRHNHKLDERTVEIGH